MVRTKVAIVGAGLAGLHAARLLRARRVDFVVLEARDRPGGRILTVDAAGRPAADGFDLGPSWYWPRTQPAISELIAELGLASFAQHGEGDVLVERTAREGPQRYRGGMQDPPSFRLVGGTGALVDALLRDLPRERLQLGARVAAMALEEGDGVRLTIHRADGSTESLVAEHVIAALPPRLIASALTFTPAQDHATARRWRETPTWMAPHAKFVALYERPFWREAGLSGAAQSMIGPMSEMHDATTASRQAALFGFLGVGAEQRVALGEEALIRACVEQLVRLFGPEARHPRATLLKDWAADPLTATPADRVAGGHPVPAPGPWVSGPWRDRLTLGGCEVSPSEPGYLAGAVIAATRAADETIRKVAAGG